MKRVYVDTSVLLNAAGEPGPRREVAAAYLAGVGDRLALHVSVETIQEFTFHRMRRGERAHALAQTEALMRTVVILPFSIEVLRRSLELVRTTHLRGRDAVHAATALEEGIDTIVTFDSDFDDVPGLTVLRP